MRFHKLEQALQRFVDSHNQMEKQLVELRKTVKEEGMRQVQDHMRFERSEDAKRTIDELNEMNNLTFKSNAKDIEKYVMQIFSLENEAQIEKKEVEPTIESKSNEVSVSGNEEVSVEDIKTLLHKRGFQFKRAREGHLEFLRNEDFYFIVPLFEGKSDNEIKRLLNTKFRFRNIGFLCANTEIKSAVRRVTDEWTKENDKKFHYLIVHFASIADIELTEDFFETIDYSKKKATN